MLLDKGADVNHKDKEQWTALHLAVCNDDNTPIESTYYNNNNYFIVL